MYPLARLLQSCSGGSRISKRGWPRSIETRGGRVWGGVFPQHRGRHIKIFGWAISSESSGTNDEIRCRTGQPLLSDTVRSRCLSFFGHLHRTDPSQDHYRALQACILGPPDDWRQRIGRPRQSWLRTVEADLRPMNLGLATSKRRAQDRSAWRKLVTPATFTTSS